MHPFLSDETGIYIFHHIAAITKDAISGNALLHIGGQVLKTATSFENAVLEYTGEGPASAKISRDPTP